MGLTEKLQEQFSNFHKVIWIMLVPIILDIAQLLAYQKLYRITYEPLTQIRVKLSFISAPPSVRYILEDYPSFLFHYGERFQGILNTLTLANVSLAISVLLVISFFHSGYMSIISEAGRNSAGVKTFFVLGNRHWFKYFVLQVLVFLPMILMLISKEWLYLSVIFVIFVYVQYSIVVDEGSILNNFRRGGAFLFNNLGLSIKMAIYFGLLLSVLGMLIVFLVNLGFLGLMGGIVLTAYFGGVVNKTVLEIYREVSHPNPQPLEDDNPTKNSTAAMV